MSQESGVPTFRDELSGLWANFDPAELATESAFRKNPARVFGWYVARLRKVRAAEPHHGYLSLVALEDRFDQLTVITQNVDGLHSRAGSSSVLEIHGSLERFRCLDAAHPYEYDPPPRGEESSEDIEPPVCTVCGSLIRPGVVWFGEILPERVVQQAWDAASKADAMMVIGTSAEVYPAADLPRVAAESGAAVIELNPMSTPLSRTANYCLRETAAGGLGAINDALAGAKKNDG